MTTPQDFLLGGGGKSAKFENLGDSISGTIATNPEIRQQSDIKTGKPLTWDDGSPRNQLVVSLQTDERLDSEDDGLRNLYVKGSKKPGSQSLHDAVATAVRQAGAKGLEVGGELDVILVGEEPPPNPNLSPRKLYKATYTAPSANTQSEFLGTTQQVETTQAPPVHPMTPSQPIPPVQQQPPAAPLEMVRSLIQTGLDDAAIAQATGTDIALVTAIRNAAQ